MTDWLDKLAEEFRDKRKQDTEAKQNQQAYDSFISGHGEQAWKDLMGLVGEGCQHLSGTAGASLKFTRDSEYAFIVTGAPNPLDVEMDYKTKIVSWAVRNTSTKGKLAPDREGNELVYRVYRETKESVPLSVTDVAAFLLRKAF